MRHWSRWASARPQSGDDGDRCTRSASATAAPGSARPPRARSSSASRSGARPPSPWPSSAAISRCAPSRPTKRRARRARRSRSRGSSSRSTLPDGLLSGKPAALAAVDDVVVARVLSSSIVRVKIWSADGRVLYSDDPAQIGGHYALDSGQLALLRDGGAKVEVSDLSHPENTARPRPRRSHRGLHADPHAVRHAGAVRGLPAHGLDHVGRAPPAAGARAADPRGDRADRAHPGAADLVAHAQVAARARGARGAARQRDRGVGARAPARRRVPPRRARAGDRRPRLLARAAGRQRGCPRRRRRGRSAALHDRAPPPHGARSALAARRAPPAASGGRRARVGDRRPRQSAAGGRRLGVARDRRHGAPRPREGGAHLPRRAGGRAQRDRLRRTPPRCASRCTRDDGMARLVVSDDGRGFDSDDARDSASPRGIWASR